MSSFWRLTLNFKRIFGLLAIVVGIALIIFSVYGTKQLNEGKLKIADAKKKVSQSNQLFSLNPISKEIGKGMTSGAEGKIAAGERTVEEYERLFKWCQIGGIALIVLGVGFVIFGRTNQKRTR